MGLSRSPTTLMECECSHHCASPAPLVPIDIFVALNVMHLSMLSPRGITLIDINDLWGTWPLLPSPPSGIWLRIWVPGWGRLLFLRGRIGPSHIVPRTCLCAGHLGIEVARLKRWKTPVFKDVRANCFCASLLRTQMHTPRHTRARALSNKMRNDRAKGHCYSFAWI